MKYSIPLIVTLSCLLPLTMHAMDESEGSQAEKEKSDKELITFVIAHQGVRKAFIKLYTSFDYTSFLDKNCNPLTWIKEKVMIQEHLVLELGESEQDRSKAVDLFCSFFKWALAKKETSTEPKRWSHKVKNGADNSIYAQFRFSPRGIKTGFEVVTDDEINDKLYACTSNPYVFKTLYGKEQLAKFESKE